jgi:curved DNA-binding protein CbpA
LRSGEFMTVGTDSQKLPAKTLYDLFRVRRGDDAETLQSAFRNAAKANHPDLNPGDPDAPRRFRQITAAYAILRDAEHREAYDRLLDRQVALERAQRRAKLTRTIVSDTAVIVAFTVVLVGGYTLYAHVSKTSVGAKVVEVAARKPADITAAQPTIGAETANRVQPSERAEIHVVEPLGDMSHRGEPSSKSVRVELADVPIDPSVVTPVAKSNEPLIIANGSPDPDPTVSNSGVAKAVDALDPRVDRGDARNGADDHKRNEDSNPIDQNKVLSVKPQFSSSEKDISVVKPTSPNLAKHYFRTTGKLRVLAKLPAIDRTSSVRQAVVEGRDMSQVALESRNTSACVGSCSNRPPPLFGVGF